MKRTLIGLLPVVVGMMVISGVVGGYMFWVDHFVVQPYLLVCRGDSESQVIARLGTPSRITGRPENVAWDSEASITVNRAY
jgi:hypothetical protein